jgi:hypothetical protein
MISGVPISIGGGPPCLGSPGGGPPGGGPPGGGGGEARSCDSTKFYINAQRFMSPLSSVSMSLTLS